MKRYIIQQIDPRKTWHMVKVVGESDSLPYCVKRIKALAGAYEWDTPEGYSPLAKDAEPFLIYRVCDTKADTIAHVAIYMDGCHTIISRE